MNSRRDNLSISFEWHSVARDIIHNFWIIVMAVLMGVMGIYIAEHSVYLPEYTSSATLVVKSKNVSTSTFSNLSESSEMATIYSNVFVQPAMKKLAAAKMGKEALSGRITAEVLKETNIMTIMVTAPGPELAYNELKAVLDVYPMISENVFSDSVIDIIKTPDMPRGPSNAMSKSRRALIIALVALISLAGIIVLSLFRDTVKSEKDFQRKIDAKLLGRVTYENKMAKGFRKRSMLINDTAASLGFVESFQKIATRLEYLHKREGVQTILFTSVASKESKTTTAINTAMALASRGYKVILFDVDFLKPSVAKRLNVKVPDESELGNLLSGKVSPLSYKFLKYRKGSLYLALCGRKNDGYREWMDDSRISEYVEKLKKTTDFIILDSSPISVSSDASHGMRMADRTVMVIRTDRAYAADINEAVLSVADYGGNLAGCVLTYVHKEFSLFGQMGSDETEYQGRYGYGGYKRPRYGSYKSGYDYVNGYYSAGDNTTLQEFGDRKN
ncbi:MAG: AAA family ATPase [Parasporobacterium sp.]|nr:AAA family ATPase [Parasporobacterium sp.]